MRNFWIQLPLHFLYEWWWWTGVTHHCQQCLEQVNYNFLGDVLCTILFTTMACWTVARRIRVNHFDIGGSMTVLLLQFDMNNLTWLNNIHTWMDTSKAYTQIHIPTQHTSYNTAVLCIIRRLSLPISTLVMAFWPATGRKYTGGDLSVRSSNHWHTIYRHVQPPEVTNV